MTRRGTLQRSLIALLALLMVTPQVLLRPCCCVRGSTESGASAESTAPVASSLPPCCLKRLQAAQQAAVAERDSSSRHPGVHDTGRCGCRNGAVVARLNRSVFKSVIDNQVTERTSFQNDHADVGLMFTSSISRGHSPPPDIGLGHCIRLCRWLV